MEFKLNITIAATPELTAILLALVSAKPVAQAQNTSAEDAKQTGTEEDALGAKVAKIAKAAKAKKTEAADNDSTVNASDDAAEKKGAGGKQLSLEEVQSICREVIDEDENNRDKIKSILSKDFEVPELRKLDAANYPSFIKKVKALAL